MTNYMVNNEIIIRPAKKADIPAIFKLVVRLAEFENEPEAVTANLEDYNSSFNQGWWSSEVATLNNKVIGMTIFYKTFSTWKGKMMYLEDFYVDQAYRRQGVGELLFKSFIKKAKSEQCVLVKWQVLDWNETALRFYDKMNAEIQKGWWNGIIRFKKDSLSL